MNFLEQLSSAIVISSMFAAGIIICTAYASFLRVLLGLELMAFSASLALILLSSVYDTYLAIIAIETATATVAAGLAVEARRRSNVSSADELSRSKM